MRTIQDKMINRKERNLLLGGNMWYFGEGLFGPLFALYSQRVGGDILDISIAWAAFLVVSGVLTVVVGQIADVTKQHEKIMIAGYFLNALFTFAYLLVDSHPKLLIVQIGLGFASALASPTWDALYAKHENPKRKGLAWGMAGGGADVVTGIAVLVGGFIVTNYSFEALFISMGSIQLIAAIYQSRILKIKN